MACICFSAFVCFELFLFFGGFFSGLVLFWVVSWSVGWLVGPLSNLVRHTEVFVCVNVSVGRGCPTPPRGGGMRMFSPLLSPPPRSVHRSVGRLVGQSVGSVDLSMEREQQLDVRSARGGPSRSFWWAAFGCVLHTWALPGRSIGRTVGRSAGRWFGRPSVCVFRFVSFRLSPCLCMSLCLSVSLFRCLCVYMYLCLFVPQSICPSVSLFLCLCSCVSLSLGLSLCPYVCLSVCL